MASQFTLEDRETIDRMQFANCELGEIATKVGKHRSSVYRELKRNSVDGKYRAAGAQRMSEQRRRDRPLKRKMERPDVKRSVHWALKHYWSPDEISGRLQLAYASDRSKWISHQAIYDWICGQPDGGARWGTYLRRGVKRRKRSENTGKIPEAVSVEGRPKIVDKRSRRGDWEGDTIVGPPGRGGALTLVDRKSRYLLMARVKNLKADTVCEASVKTFQMVPRKYRKTATFDNGKEFASHAKLSRRTGLAVYFARPYSPWQRGTNENTNGLIRQFFPKGTDLASVPEPRINQVQELLNNRPRRCLGYRTPNEVFSAKRTRVAFET
jgi:transposase, IS30 family